MNIDEFLPEQMDYWMRRCIAIALESQPSINGARVGALVLDKSHNIVGEGKKSFLGSTSFVQHAERAALDHSYGRKGVTLVTTLEPCMGGNKRNLFKPCAEHILDSGIKTLIIGLEDHSAYGGGANFLKGRGLRVIYFTDYNHIILQRLLLNPNKIKENGRRDNSINIPYISRDTKKLNKDPDPYEF